MRKNQKKPVKDTHYSSLENHRRDGKTFVPPLMQHGKVSLMSWRDARVPEILWAVLLADALQREAYLDIFRAVVRRAVETTQFQLGCLNHSSLKDTQPAAFDYAFEPLFRNELVARGLSCLLLLRKLPDRLHWERHLAPPEPETDWYVLAQAIAATTDHQSQKSTDCRWLRVLHEVSRGRMEAPGRFLQEITEYPELGDMRAVRPIIRSCEGAIEHLSRESVRHPWPEEFWAECWNQTSCTPAHRREEQRIETADIAKELATIYGDVTMHFRRTIETTSIDPRHDSVFGIVLYGIGLAHSVCAGNSHQRIEGRIAIRSMAECYITLAFLLKRDQPGLWQKYRSYGSGQAKLAYLKTFELDSPGMPSYVNAAELEVMASEDAWLEFVSIDVGNWAGTDLRRMSEQIDAKPIYDKYFTWPSNYVHGHWGAVRDTNFGICLNPLHRYHRVPMAPSIAMGSVAPASIKLTNLLLEALNKAYPQFKRRIASSEADKSAATQEDE